MEPCDKGERQISLLPCASNCGRMSARSYQNLDWLKEQFRGSTSGITGHCSRAQVLPVMDDWVLWSRPKEYTHVFGCLGHLTIKYWLLIFVVSMTAFSTMLLFCSGNKSVYAWLRSAQFNTPRVYATKCYYCIQSGNKLLDLRLPLQAALDDITTQSSSISIRKW